MADQINMIEILLKQSLLAIKPIAPHNFASLINDIFHLELEQEIEFLRKELTCPETFKDRFRARWIEREIALNAIPCSVAPQSVTNQLYFKIAMTIFEIKTQRELLAIILPSVIKKLHINITDTLSEKLTSSEQIKENIALSFFVDDYQDDGCPDINALSHVVISNYLLIDLREIEKFPFFLHVKVYAHLKENYPDLAFNVYSHNPSLQTLADDILLMSNKGTPPKVAIECLIKGLVLGGEMSDNDCYAGEPANVAAVQFLIYLESLSPSLQNDLFAIRGIETLGEIFNNEIIMKDSFVSIASHKLRNLLSANVNHPLLINPPLLAKEGAILEKKYNARNVLNTEKEAVFANKKLPNDLLKKSLQKIKPNEGEFIVLLLNFSIHYYDTIFKFADLSNISDGINLLIKIREQDFFNSEQKYYLLKAIVTNFDRLKQKKSIYSYWENLHRENMARLKMALSSFSKSDKLLIFLKDNPSVFLGCVIKYPELINVLLEFLPEADHLAMTSIANNGGETILHGVLDRLELLKTMLAMYDFVPINKRLSVVKIKDNVGHDILRHSLFCYPESPESLKAILEFLPETDRLEACNGILHLAADKPNLLKVVLSILEYIPKAGRLSIIQATNGDGNTILHKAAFKPESLKAILEFLPEVDHFAAFSTLDKNNNTILHLVVDHFEHLKFNLLLFPKSDRMKAIKIANKQGKTALHLTSSKIELLEVILFSDEIESAIYSRNYLIEKCIIISDIRDYFFKFQIESELHDTTVAKIIALILLKNKLYNLSDQQTLVDVFKQWKNEKSFVYPSQSNLELINSADYPGDAIRFFGHSSSTTKSASQVLLEKITPLELPEKKSDEKKDVVKRK